MAALPGAPVVPDPRLAWFGMQMDQYATERFKAVLEFLRTWGWDVRVIESDDDHANFAHWRANVDLFRPLPDRHNGRALEHYLTPLSTVSLAAYICKSWAKGQAQDLMRRDALIYYNPSQ